MHEDDVKLNNLLKGGNCPPGQVLRKGYIATRKKKGFIGRLLKRGTMYRVNDRCVTRRRRVKKTYF